MAGEIEKVEIPYTETFDQFTVFFYGDHVFLSGKEMPLGQNTVDILNMDEQVLDEIDRRVRDTIPAIRRMLQEKTDSAVASVQEKLNAVWDIIFTLPVYRTMNMDRELSYKLFHVLRSDPEKWAQVLDTASEGHAMFEGLLEQLACFTQRLRDFRGQIVGIAKFYFEPLKRRSSAAYAEAYSYYYADMLTAGAMLFHGQAFEQAFPMEVSFVPMMHPTEEGKVFVAEKTRFNDLSEFLRVEFYRALMAGNAPRRCHNCGKYFLLTAGYNTCYCSNIAPGETKRTCRKVGAHRKEAQGKANQTPTQKEYAKTYNRLKGRKQRGKISTDEWNAAVAKAQELVAQSDRGELTDEELIRQLGEL